MENIPAYIKRLLDINENIQKKINIKENRISTSSFEDNLYMLLCKFDLKNDFRCKNDKLNISYLKYIENFITALILSIRIAKSYENQSIITINDSLFKNRLAGPRKMAFVFSKFNLLLLNNPDKYDIDDTDDFDEITINTKKYPLSIKKLKHMPIKCNKLLKPLCDAVICNILNYPYAFPFSHYFTTDEYKQTQLLEKQYKKDSSETKINPISEYPIDSDTNCRYVTNEYATDHSIILKVLSPKIRDIILSTGGPLPAEFFAFQEDITFHNPNLENPKRGSKFYSSTYKLFFEECADYDKDLKLFQYFSIESILKGTTLFSFCRYFSSNSGDKFINKIEGLESEYGKKTLSNIYCSIDSIDNPFLKDFIIEEILPNSFYKDYYYNEKLYTAGKKDITKWCNFIENYCLVFRKIEHDIYPLLITNLFESFNNSKINIQNIDNALTAYENLFSKNIYDLKKQQCTPLSRSARFPLLLRIILIAASYDKEPHILNNLP